MTCKAECPNTDVCEHGYCPPHRLSYCKCKDVSTQPIIIDGETLVQYLSQLQFNAAKWAYMKIHGGITEEDAAAKLFADRQMKAAKIEALCQGVAKEARLDEAKNVILKRLLGSGEPKSAKIVWERVSELTGNKNGLLASSETPTALSNEADNLSADKVQFDMRPYFPKDGGVGPKLQGMHQKHINITQGNGLVPPDSDDTVDSSNKPSSDPSEVA
jgi:hypothetical protein